MFFLGKPKNQANAAMTSFARGQAGEDQALAYLQSKGLRLLERNYRTPGRTRGEIDLILQESDGTVVFVEVRCRASMAFGGAGASIDAAKCQRVVHTAQHWLLHHGTHCACRFDVVVIDGGQLQWLRAAFEGV